MMTTTTSTRLYSKLKPEATPRLQPKRKRTNQSDENRKIIRTHRRKNRIQNRWDGRGSCIVENLATTDRPLPLTRFNHATTRTTKILAEQTQWRRRKATDQSDAKERGSAGSLKSSRSEAELEKDRQGDVISEHARTHEMELELQGVGDAVTLARAAGGSGTVDEAERQPLIQAEEPRPAGGSRI
jgi:hypothetical protein